MLEIELKFPVADFDQVKAALHGWQARVEESVVEADHYFNAPDRDFARTDEAFRLRCVGPHNRATYKGPKQPGPTKTRTEIEVSLADGEDVAETFTQLVRNLGYRPVAVVRKRRVCYHCDRAGFALTITCDEVDEVGRYVEVEIVAPEADQARAQQALLGVVQELGLGQPEPRAYLQLLLDRRGEGS